MVASELVEVPLPLHLSIPMCSLLYRNGFLPPLIDSEYRLFFIPVRRFLPTPKP